MPADIIGMLSLIFLVSIVDTSVSFGRISDFAGIRSTSSKVKPSFKNFSIVSLLTYQKNAVFVVLLIIFKVYMFVKGMKKIQNIHFNSKINYNMKFNTLYIIALIYSIMISLKIKI